MTARTLSGVERLWLVADRIAPPFVNQLVLEGEGTPDEGALRGAVEVLSRWPLCRARRIGALRRARWAPGGVPFRFRRVEARDWSGRGPQGAPFLQDPLPATSGPLLELVLVVGAASRLVLRTAHAFMDGRGTLELAAALFAAARGENPSPIGLGGPTDVDLARDLGQLPEPPVPANCAPPLPVLDPSASGLTWARVTASIPPRGLLPRLAWALGEVADPSARCRVDVPVDLRRHAPGLRSTANLTGLVRLAVDGHRGREEPARRLGEELDRRLARGEEAAFVLASERLRVLPLRTLERIGRRRASGGYGATANLSNVGRLDLAGLSGAGFRARTGFFIPPGAPSLPLFLALTGGSEGVELCATMPRVFGGEDVLRGLLGRLVKAAS